MTTVNPTSANGVAAFRAVAGKVAESEEMSKLREAAKGFEAVFVRKLLSEMRSSGFGDDLTGSSSVDQFQEMADARTADTLAERGSFGIAEMMIKQLAPKHAATYAAQDAAATAPGKEG